MACVSSPTRTLFSTQTSLITTVQTALTTFVVGTSTIVAGTVTRLSLVTGVAVTTTSSVLATATDTVLSSSPVSTLFAECTDTTSSTTTSRTTSTTSATTSAITATRGGTTVTAFTTVGPTSGTTTSATSSSTSGSNNSGSSSTPVGAIAGGVVGGIAVILLGALAIWWFSTKGSRKDRDKDFDFAEDDAWDPAAGVASGAMVSSRMSRRRSGGGGGSRRNGGGGGGMAMAGMQGGYGDEGYNDVNRSNTLSRKKVAPADEQFAYYASAPPPPSTTSNALSANAGIAGVGALGRQASHSSPSSREYEDPYGGLENPGNGAGDGGYGVASRMAPSTSQGQLSRVAQLGGTSSQPYAPPMSMPQPYTNYAPQQPAYNRQGSGYDNSLPPLPQQLQRQGSDYSSPLPLPGTPLSIPYHSPAPLSAPSSSRFDIPPISSPAPSHRSIPALGAWNDEGEEEGNRRGPLRVTNEEDEEEVARFGRGSGAYEGLTEGLGKRD